MPSPDGVLAAIDSAAEAIANHGLRLAPEAARDLAGVTPPAPAQGALMWPLAGEENPHQDMLGETFAEARQRILAEVERQGLVPVGQPHMVMPPPLSDDSLMYEDSLSVKMVVWARPPDGQEDA